MENLGDFTKEVQETPLLRAEVASPQRELTWPLAYTTAYCIVMYIN